MRRRSRPEICWICGWKSLLGLKRNPPLMPLEPNPSSLVRFDNVKFHSIDTIRGESKLFGSSSTTMEMHSSSSSSRSFNERLRLSRFSSSVARSFSSQPIPASDISFGRIVVEEPDDQDSRRCVQKFIHRSEFEIVIGDGAESLIEEAPTPVKILLMGLLKEMDQLAGVVGSCRRRWSLIKSD